MIRRLHLDGVVRPDQSNSRHDMGQVRTAFSRLGLYDPARDPEDGVARMGAGLRRAIKTLQSGQDLREDAVLRPGGPTEALVNRLLEEGRGFQAADKARALRRDGRLPADRIGPGLENHPEDLRSIEAPLRAMGYIAPTARNPAKTSTVLSALDAFQGSNGLKRDRTMIPGGPTEQQLTLALGRELPGRRVPRMPLETGSLPEDDRNEDAPYEILASPVQAEASSSGASRPATAEAFSGRAGNSDHLGQTTVGGPAGFEPAVYRPEDPVELVPAMSPQFSPQETSSGSAHPWDPFPTDRFEMLLRPMEDLASIVRVDSDLVKAAGLTGLRALRGVASSMAHDDLRNEILDVLLNELDEAGHAELAEALRNQRSVMRLNPVIFRELWPTDRIRRFMERNESAADLLDAAANALDMAGMDVVSGVTEFGSRSSANTADFFREELERRERKKREQAGS